MKRRDFDKLNRETMMRTKGTEDIAGRRLPNEIYRLLPRGPYRPRPSKADQRDEAARAIIAWRASKARTS